MQIDVTYDQTVSSLPAGFVTAINYVVNYYDTLFTNNVTINIDVGYGEIDGQALGSNDLGESYAPQYLQESYSSVRAALLAQGAPGSSTLPSSSPLSGSLYMSQAEAQALGLTSAVSTSYVGFSSDPNIFSYTPNVTPASDQYYFIGVVEHEISEDMGRVSLLNYQPYDYSLIDLFRYSSPGVRDFTTGGAGSTAYFSINDGTTNLGTWNNQTSNGDLADWYPEGPAPGGNDSFNDYSNPGVINTVSSNDITLMEALGWTTQVNGIAVTANTSEALQGGPAVALLTTAPVITDSGQTALASAAVEITDGSGDPVTGDELYVDGQQSGTIDGGLVTVNWNDSTNTLTLTGNVSIATYQTLLSEVSYQDTGTDSSTGSHPVRTVTWTVNTGSTNYSATSQITVDRVPVADSYVATDAVGTSLTATAAAGVLSNDTDLDGDKLTVTGVSDASNGAGTVGSALAGLYGHLTLNANGSYSYTPDNAIAINMPPSGSRLQDIFTYTVSDGNGGTASASLTIVIDPVVIATDVSSSGSTSLTEVGNEYYLYNSDGVGPALKENGADVVAGEFGGWVPIGAVQTASGYDVAWEVPGANEYSIWTVDSNGNYLSNDGVLSGTSYALESLETTFDQDLNGDGTIGLTRTVIRTDGSTSLTEVGNEYYLYNSDGVGPALKENGADVVAGEFGGWVPIGAVQTASGYDVAWEVPGANEYSIWTVDSNGNYLSNDGVLSGTSYALESLETTFDQDLNGDGTIGLTRTVIRTDGSTSLTEVANQYYLYNGSGVGPALKENGADVVAGEFGGWVPIGAVQTASGYDVAWEVPGANEYSIWTVDSNGNYLSNDGVLSGTSYALESFAPVFGQDLNGGGVTRVPTVIQTDTGSFGSTSLTAVWYDYFLDNSGGSGPALKYGGADVVAGEFGGWVPIGAVQTVSGYDVAWEIPGANEYSIWTVDSNGNYLESDGVLAGNSYALESLEATFGQDLNGDGVIGPLIAAGATLEIDTPYAGPVTFAGSTGTLQLENQSSFTGTVAGLTGQDTLDLMYINIATVQTPTYSGNSSGGVLSVTDGTHTANIALLGNYLASTFVPSSDGHGGTAIVDPVVASSNQQMILAPPQHA